MTYNNYMTRWKNGQLLLKTRDEPKLKYNEPTCEVIFRYITFLTTLTHKARNPRITSLKDENEAVCNDGH